MQFFSKLNVEEVLNYLPDPILVIDTLGNIQFHNDSFSTLLGYTPEEFNGKNIINYLVDDSVFENCMLELQNHQSCLDQSTVFLAKNKKHITTTKNVKLINIEDEKFIFVNIRDISYIDQINYELNSSKRELEERSKKLVTLLDDHKKQIMQKQLQLDEIVNIIDEIIWYIDERTMEVMYVSDAVEKIFGQSKEVFLKNPSLWMNLVLEEDKNSVMHFFSTLHPSESNTVDFRIQREDGEMRWLSSTVTHHPSSDFFIGVTRDVTREKKAQEDIEFMAYHDVLTSLPNRSFLKDEINRLLKKAEVISQEFAVLFLDLDNFKYINDSMGHDIGDELLIEIANKLKHTIGKKGVCTRFGGDEFVILMPMQNTMDISIKAQEIIDSLNTPYKLEEHEFFVSSSIGISLYPVDAKTATELIKSADTAMYAAKMSGKNRYTFFDESMNTNINEFLKVESYIKEALANDYFTLHFQPLIHAKNNALYGFEALLRMEHPEHGFISPDKFIPVAEGSGDIIKINDYVMKNACEFANQVNALSKDQLVIAVNISSRQFKESHFAKNFLKNLSSLDTSTEFIKIEITESVLMENLNVAQKEFKILQQAGVKIALDDFGTGYSSFEYLAQLPIDTVKIDKSFIMALFDKESNAHIIKAITSLAHALEMDVTAEGIETKEQAEFLKNNKVDLLQGFYYTKALTADEILNDIKKGKKLLLHP